MTGRLPPAGPGRCRRCRRRAGLLFGIIWVLKRGQRRRAGGSMTGTTAAACGSWPGDRRDGSRKVKPEDGEGCDYCRRAVKAADPCGVPECVFRGLGRSLPKFCIMQFSRATGGCGGFYRGDRGSRGHGGHVAYGRDRRDLAASYNLAVGSRSCACRRPRWRRAAAVSVRSAAHATHLAASLPAGSSERRSGRTT